MRYDTTRIKKDQLQRVLNWVASNHDQSASNYKSLEDLLQNTSFEEIYKLWQETTAMLVHMQFGDPAMHMLTRQEEDLRMVGSFLRIMDTTKPPVLYTCMMNQPSFGNSSQYARDFWDFVEIYHRGDEPPCKHEFSQTVSFVIDEKDWKEMREMGHVFGLRSNTTVKEFSGYGYTY